MQQFPHMEGLCKLPFLVSVSPHEMSSWCLTNTEVGVQKWFKECQVRSERRDACKVRLLIWAYHWNACKYVSPANSPRPSPPPPHKLIRAAEYLVRVCHLLFPFCFRLHAPLGQLEVVNEWHQLHYHVPLGAHADGVLLTGLGVGGWGFSGGDAGMGCPTNSLADRFEWMCQVVAGNMRDMP